VCSITLYLQHRRTGTRKIDVTDHANRSRDERSFPWVQRPSRTTGTQSLTPASTKMCQNVYCASGSATEGIVVGEGFPAAVLSLSLSLSLYILVDARLPLIALHTEQMLGRDRKRMRAIISCRSLLCQLSLARCGLQCSCIAQFIPCIPGFQPEPAALNVVSHETLRLTPARPDNSSVATTMWHCSHVATS
jgi:hypothetical protein